MTDDLVKRLRTAASDQSLPIGEAWDLMEIAADALEQARAASQPAQEPVALTDAHVETFVTQYNDVYCDQRKAGVGGGDAERAAMKQVLILALGAFHTAPPSDDEAVRLLWRARFFICNVPTDEQLDAVLAGGDTGRAIWGDLDAYLAKGKK